MLGILIVLYGVAGSERTIKRVWDISQQANLSGKPQTGRFTEKGTVFPSKGEWLGERKGRKGIGKGVLYICISFLFT